MFYESVVGEIGGFTEKLMDDESKELYDARFQYYFDKDEDVLQDRIMKIAPKYKDSFFCWGLSSYYSRHSQYKGIPLVIFGAGNMGKTTIRTLSLLGKQIDCVVDNSESVQGKTVCGYTVESPQVIKGKDCVVIVAVKWNQQIGIYYQLLNLGVPEERILMHQEGGLYLDFGRQYFDVKEVAPNRDGEIFVDAGCFNGKTSVNASKWANGMLKKVYAFEPDKNSMESCEVSLKSIGCEFELFNYATWNKREQVCFDIHENAGYGSKVVDNGGVWVEANSIDNVIDGRPVTYIKLDVEGSELKTLQGAISTINRWRPKLAISIYHKPEDIIEIPRFLETLELGYKYYIRQYQSRIFETTLYAI